MSCFFYFFFRFLVFLFFFFFFQAEDGIRDTSVTGVQTCALPISSGRTRVAPGVAAPRFAVPCGFAIPPRLRSHRPPFARLRPPRDTVLGEARRRSEERRVGKECRARWWG